MELDTLNSTTLLNNTFNQLLWSHVELYFRHRMYTIKKDDLPFTIGRDDTCNLLVKSDYASRTHCSIEIHEGQIGIFDRSTNGTFIELGRAGGILIKHDFCPLTGQGRLSLGDKIRPDDPSLILFKIVNKPEGNENK